MTDTLVLCYHAVSDSWDSKLAVTAAQLTKQLEILVDRGYRGVTFSSAMAGEHRGKVVAITFDDAYRSVFERARPILDEAGVPATVFVPTAFPSFPRPMRWVGIDNWLRTPDRDELIPMSWAQARELDDAGWEIGSHTVNHPKLTEVEADSLSTELTSSRRQIEAEIGKPCRSIAYPYGDTDRHVQEAAGRAGYLYAAALPTDEWSQPSRLNHPRIGIYRADSLRTFKRKISPALRHLRHSRAWPHVAATARRISRRI